MRVTASLSLLADASAALALLFTRRRPDLHA
jgi:hypothetical protein